MNAVESLQSWYLAQCNDAWEHTHGVAIGTLDNPGWSLTVDLAGTPLEFTPFVPVSYGIAEREQPSGNDWLVCKVQDSKFFGHGGPAKLEEMIRVFLSWAAENHAGGEPVIAADDSSAT